MSRRDFENLGILRRGFCEKRFWARGFCDRAVGSLFIDDMIESYIKCRSCHGDGCDDGENAALEECHHGEGSCFYGHVKGT